MTDQPNHAVECPIRCLAPSDVAMARERAGPGRLAWIEYGTKACGEMETIPRPSESQCVRLAEDLSLDGPLEACLLAALVDRELCEADLATLAWIPEDETLSALARLERAGHLRRRDDEYMHHYRHAESGLESRLRARLAALD